MKEVGKKEHKREGWEWEMGGGNKDGSPQS